MTGIEHDPVHCELLKKLNDLEQTHFDWIQASLRTSNRDVLIWAFC
ncbi:hypothetical protein VQ056_14330 [Paenibacillus sp. JTLBN-2024]